MVAHVSNQRRNTHQTRKATSKVTATGVAFSTHFRTARLSLDLLGEKSWDLCTEYT